MALFLRLLITDYLLLTSKFCLKATALLTIGIYNHYLLYITTLLRKALQDKGSGEIPVEK